jgi:hypothetical protein
MVTYRVLAWTRFSKPSPIGRIRDRWVSTYAEPWAVTPTGLKRRLEET